MEPLMKFLRTLLIEANFQDTADLLYEDKFREIDYEDMPYEDDEISFNDDLEEDPEDPEYSDEEFDEYSDEEFDELPEEDLNDEDDSELDLVASTATDDPDKQGLLRNVIGAHLVYKRCGPDGKYEELWVYKGGEDMKDSLKVRRSILSGTDILPNTTISPSGEQSYSTWAAGNCEMLNIKGLEN